MTLPSTQPSAHRALVKLVVVALLLGVAIGSGVFRTLALLWGEGPVVLAMGPQSAPARYA